MPSWLKKEGVQERKVLVTYEATYDIADTEEYIAAKHKREVEAQVASLEASTGLIRPLRETITAGQIPVSMYILNKVQEIDTLAQELRDSTVGGENAA